ncbi:MAG: tRNA (adenine-N1)-methyltransferase [Propionibacteriaceae bacterium]|nr:tRNA (adenine-N1)-methyltransferase [Propionibacteriaceae bacterium]
MSDNVLNGVKAGPLQPGERVTLTDPKGRRHSVILKPGAAWHTTKGAIYFDDIIGGDDGQVVTSENGMQFLVFRPILREHTVSMKRGATIIYPKDAGEILVEADIFPGARVLEAGAGSGALSLFLLRAIGAGGRLYSYEIREEFAEIAKRNVETFFGAPHPAWELRIGDLREIIGPEPIDRAILDMLAPWDCVDAVADVLVPGGILCVYVATTTQLGRVMDTLRVHGGFTEPEGRELNIRFWHAEGLAIRPAHTTQGHTGFLVFTRRLAPGVTAPIRRRRPAPGAYGPDYHGPIPDGVDRGTPE